jgi:hypothetical protein
MKYTSISPLKAFKMVEEPGDGTRYTGSNPAPCNSYIGG